ncbi:MAG: hypothetical protein WD851_06535 [Pirellulales bacterium]
MRSQRIIAVTLFAALAICASNTTCQAFERPYMGPLRRAQVYNWHANYAHVQYGQPVAMVVPPTANLQTNWSWGVASSRISRIDHQFGRNYPGVGPFGGPFSPQPVWPNDTIQFGVYNVRGPW